MTVPASHFGALYATSADPYGFGQRWYEQRKRAVTLAVLPNVRYRHAFEPGCSVGYLSAELAGRCESLLVCDVSAAAVGYAAQRLAQLAHVRVEQRELPGEWPPGTFDLVVLSEVAYYFADEELSALVSQAVTSLEPGGTLLACHWRHPGPYPQTAEQVHHAIAAEPRLALTAHYDDADFLLEVFGRTPPAALSVAQQEGIRTDGSA